jgi:aldehyde dehydrogenase (NAD+)
MRDYLKFYIDGQWVEPKGKSTVDVINPATEAVAGRVTLGTADDVDLAVRAARKAFPAFSQTSREERVDLLERIIAEYQKRFEDMAKAITEEMGAPSWLAQRAQAAMGIAHVQTALQVLKDYKFEEDRGTTRLVKEPIGVCAFITPWNWPINQIAARSRRPWPPAAPWCSSPRKWRRSRPGSGPRSWRPPACRPGSTTWSTATARPWARR